MDARDDARRVAVVGGGVAGLSAAIHLAEAGLPVELYERFDVLGGKVKGWDTVLPGGQGGTQPVEHGMHGWWTHYHNFRRYFDRTRAHGEGGQRPELIPVRRVWWVDALRLGPNGQGRWVLDKELVDALFGLWNLWPIFNLRRWSTYARLLRVGFGLFGPAELIRIGIIAVALRFGWVGWTLSRLHSGYRDIFALVSPDPPTRLDGQTIRELMESAPVG